MTGQGTSNIRKLRVTLDNYERRARPAITWLCSRPEVDAERIAVFGCSMARTGHPSGRIRPKSQGRRDRVSCYTSKRLLFDVGSPRFKRIFMYMTESTTKRRSTSSPISMCSTLISSV